MDENTISYGELMTWVDANIQEWRPRIVDHWQRLPQGRLCRELVECIEAITAPGTWLASQRHERAEHGRSIAARLRNQF